MDNLFTDDQFDEMDNELSPRSTDGAYAPEYYEKNQPPLTEEVKEALDETKRKAQEEWDKVKDKARDVKDETKDKWRKMTL